MQQAGTRNSLPPPSSFDRLYRIPMDDRHVFLVSLALLLVATTHAAGGHATQPAAAAAAAAITQQGTDDSVVVGSMTRRNMIGSSPPSCKGRCGWWCVGRSCEAVAVPVQPPQEELDNTQSRRHGSGSGGDDGSRAPAAAQRRRPSSYDDRDHSKDYEPVVWRCKCVGYI